MKRRFLKLVLVFIIGLFASNNVSSQEVNMNKWIDLKVEQGAEIDISLAADTSGVRALVRNGYSERYIYMIYDISTSQSYTFYAYDTIIRIYGDVSQIRFRETNFQLHEINFDNNTDITYLDCIANGLDNINLRPLQKLEYLILSIVNRIEYIDASNLSQLLFLSVSGDKLRELNIEGSINIEGLYFYYTLISNIDLRGMNKLRDIYCYSNNLTSSALDSIYCALPEYSGIGNDYGEIVVYADDLHASSVYPIVMASNSQNAISKGWHVVDRAFQDMPPTNGTFDCSNIGIEDIELSKIEAKIYPNPAIDNLNIGAKENILTLEVFDALGRKVMSTNPKQKSITLDVSNLEKGIYILKLQTEKGIGSYKVIKN